MKTTAFVAKTLFSAALLVCGVAAQAQNVLMLTTQDAANTSVLEAIRDAYAAAGATVEYQRGALSNATPIASSQFSGRDVVLVVSVLDRIDDAQIPVLQEQMRNRPNDNTAFVLYVDGCCDTTGGANQNISRTRSMLSLLTGWSLGQSARKIIAGGAQATLNSASPYAGPFAAQPALNPSMAIHDYAAITGVPANNLIYHDDPRFPDPGAYSLFVPRSQSNGGNGACVLYSSDTTFISRGGTRYNLQRPAFVAASLALASGAHCQRSTPATRLQPVPTLEAGSLALLSAGMGLLALRRRKAPAAATRQP